MYRLIIFILAINLFAFSYAGDSNEGNDRYACVGYFHALDEEIMKIRYYQCIGRFGTFPLEQDAQCAKIRECFHTYHFPIEMIKADKMPACWDKKWNNMFDEVEEKLDMKEEDYRKLDDCLDEVYETMENKPEPDEKCKEAMKKVSSPDDSSKE